MKKILFVCSLYHPHVGGIETMITELSDVCRKEGIQPIILTKKWPETLNNEDEYRGVKIYRVVSARTEEEFLSIVDWIKNNESKIKADIIHVIGVRRPLPLIALLLSRYWGVPLISTVAGSEIPNEGDSHTDTVWEEGKDMMKPVLEYSDIITCVSSSLQRDLKKVVPNINQRRTIYAGIDTELIHSVVCTENEMNYIVSLRRLIPSKGVNVLIQAFQEIADEFPHTRLIIAGEGPEESNLKGLVKDLNLEERVEFIGTVSLERAVSLLKGALCTVVPSLSEGGGLLNIEAQAASCPVVASRVGGIPEYVQDNVSGLLFEAGNSKELAEKIRMLITDSSLRTNLIKGGVEHASKFSWGVLGSQYLSLYNEVIRTKQPEMFQPWSELTKKLWVELKK